MTLLDVKNMGVTLDAVDGPLEIVRDISFTLQKGEKLGIVGESGCGKSISALAITSLLPPGARIDGEINLKGDNLLQYLKKQMYHVRGNLIGMIFQEPMTALNPVKTIGSQIGEALCLHMNLERREIKTRVEELMEQVGMPVSRFPLNLYPHQLSGGQRQRVMIAMAIACEPDLLIADEPTTALDVTVQEQILDLITDLVDRLGMALIMISHDLGVIAQTTEKVAVMYTGRLVETGRTVDVFKNMAHPYTHGLFSAIPKKGSSLQGERKRLYSIAGQVPDLAFLPKGCNFQDRCRFATEICREKEPEAHNVGPEHDAWCYHPLNRKKTK